MTKTIYIHQDYLEKWFGEIDVNDAVILSYIHSWELGDVAQKHPDDERYIWIDLKTLLRENPLLSFGYDMLRKRVKRLREIGILRGKVHIHAGGRRALYLRNTIYPKGK